VSGENRVVFDIPIIIIYFPCSSGHQALYNKDEITLITANKNSPLVIQALISSMNLILNFIGSKRGLKMKKNLLLISQGIPPKSKLICGHKIGHLTTMNVTQLSDYVT